MRFHDLACLRFARQRAFYTITIYTNTYRIADVKCNWISGDYGNETSPLSPPNPIEKCTSSINEETRPRNTLFPSPSTSPNTCNNFNYLQTTPKLGLNPRTKELYPQIPHPNLTPVTDTFRYQTLMPFNHLQHRHFSDRIWQMPTKDWRSFHQWPTKIAPYNPTFYRQSNKLSVNLFTEIHLLIHSPLVSRRPPFKNSNFT